MNKNQIITISISSLVLLGLIIGCGPADTSHSTRQQMLDAQLSSIRSIESEINSIREGSGNDMAKWTPDTIKLYEKWQNELTLRYTERDRLINTMNGNALNYSTNR